MSSAIEAIRGDIAKVQADIIVNAANTSLLGGSGVDGAIHRAAGPALLDACRDLRGCKTGAAKITPGFRLPAKWIIHTVGPVWRGGSDNEPELLRSCYQNCFRLAAKKEVASIAFPSISTGTYRFPIEAAAAIAIDEARKQVSAVPLLKITFVCFSESDLGVYRALLGKD